MAMGDEEIINQCPKCYTSNPADSTYCNKCGAVLEEHQETLSYESPPDIREEEKIHLSPGKTFGKRYRIIEEIGRGGMGRVYKAEDLELDITVALKIIRPRYSADPSFIKRFKKEMLTARSISHDNIIRIFDLGEAENIKFISMEFIKGQNLKDLIRTSGALTIDKAIDITQQICRALKAAHQRGISHRDLKPSNIMVDTNGNVHVMDFGLARSIHGVDGMADGKIAGTPQYLSPEQARGEKLDQRSDIYSLGFIMFEMLTGQPVFRAENTAEYIKKHQNEIPKTPSSLNPLVPPSLEKTVLKCLEKEKTKRYQNADELSRDLDVQGIMAKPTAPRFKNKISIKILYSIASILLIIALGYLIKNFRESEVPSISERGRKSIAVMYFENNTGNDNLDNWRRALQDLLITDLHQSMYLRVLPDDRLLQILKEMKQSETDQYPSEIIDKIASEENIEYFILGSYGKAGNNYRINLKIREARTNNLLGTKIAEGTGEGSFHFMIDELTPWIKSLFITPDEIARDIDREIGKITTSSNEALNYYLQGKKCLREKKHNKSIECLEKAVAIDPEFATAYVLIAYNYEHMGYSDEVIKNLQRALELQDRVSDRERYLIQGDYYLIVEDSDRKAINIFQEYLNLYPEDETANSKLGEIYSSLEEWDQALEWHNEVLKINNRSEPAYQNLAYVFMAKGWYDQARNVLQANKNIFSNPAYFHRNMSHCYLYQGRYDLALKELDNALSIEPDDYRNIALKGNIYDVKGDLLSANKIYQQLLKKDDPLSQLEGWGRMAHLYLKQGQYEKSKNEAIQGITHSQRFNLKYAEINFKLLRAYLNLQMNHPAQAIEEVNQVLKIANETKSIDDQKTALHLSGITYLEMNMMDSAKDAAEQLRQVIEKTENKKHMRYYHDLIGRIAIENNQLNESKAEFEKAVSLLPSQVYGFGDQSLYIEPLASAFYRIEDFERSREQYEKITSLTWGQLQYGDIYARSFYWLGKIFQAGGQMEKAIEHYKTFLGIWENADPGYTEQADAKRQLEILSKVSSE